MADSDLFATPRLSDTMGGRLPTGGNLSLGFPRVERVYCLKANTLFLKGPPIEINHDLVEYDDFEYRSGQTGKYGIVGIYNETDVTDVTANISTIDLAGTTITLSSGVGVGDTCLVYYHARANHQGGSDKSCIQGDQIIPEILNMLVRGYNDAVPTQFGQYGASGDGAPIFQYAADMAYNTGISTTLDAWNTLFDTAGTGTKRWTYYPIYITEICIKYGGSVASNIRQIRITVDGEEILGGFEDDNTGIIRIMNPDPDVYLQTEDNPFHPGLLYYPTGDPAIDVGLMWEMFETDKEEVTTGPVAIRLSLGLLEVTSSLKIELKPGTLNTTNVAVYVRGYFVDDS